MNQWAYGLLIIAVPGVAAFAMWAQSASARDYWRRRRGQ